MKTLVIHLLDENEVTFTLDENLVFNGKEPNRVGNMRDFEDYGDVLGFMIINNDDNDKKEYWLYEESGETYIWW